MLTQAKKKANSWLTLITSEANFISFRPFFHFKLYPLTFCLQSLKLYSVVITKVFVIIDDHTSKYNKSSIALLEKHKFEFQADKFDKGYLDNVIYSLSRR